jgi:N-acetylneuraminate epimerase
LRNRRPISNALFTLALWISSCDALAGEWTRLASLPDNEGFAGSFAGESNGALLVAGGANFPGKKPWDGGKKVWHDHVFVLESPGKEWKDAGKLARPLGYGASVSWNGSLICAGGSDQDRHYADVFRLDWRNGKLMTTMLSPLPKPVANCSGAIVGDVLFVAGGLETPDSTTTMSSVWILDLGSKEPRWNAIEDCPGSGRMLAVASGFDQKFWLVGGVDLFVGRDGKVERRCLRDAYCFDPGTGWKRIADLPHAVVAAPSPAPTDATGFYVLGGDDCSQLSTPPDKHRGFYTTVLHYDLTTEKWSKAGEVIEPRVTVPCVRWNKSWIVPSGEVRPGVRSPEVWSWTPRNME